MPEAAPRRAAIFVDFDNVLSGLREHAGAEVARRFAEAPETWLAWLLEGAPRRAILRRCYMNPQGFLEDAAGRTWFGGFRRAFMAAGFEVVDCPPLTRFKNGADLRIALDAMDALAGPAEEFVLLSTDSDFVPLLWRLRAADRWTRLVAHPDIGRVVRAAADEVIGLDKLAAALGWRPEGAPDEMFGHDTREAVLAAVREVMEEAGAPVHLPELGKRVLERTGQTLRATDYGGHGSMDALLAAAGGFVRQDGPGGGYALRPEWLVPAAPAPESSSE